MYHIIVHLRFDDKKVTGQTQDPDRVMENKIVGPGQLAKHNAQQDLWVAVYGKGISCSR
jgi:hypothetical protein